MKNREVAMEWWNSLTPMGKSKLVREYIGENKIITGRIIEELYNEVRPDKTAFVLSYFNNPVAVLVVGDSDVELAKKLKNAIKEEVSADDDTQFELRIGQYGDYGETTKLSVTYVTDGVQLVDDEFTLMKTVMY